MMPEIANKKHENRFSIGGHERAKLMKRFALIFCQAKACATFIHQRPPLRFISDFVDWFYLLLFEIRRLTGVFDLQQCCKTQAFENERSNFRCLRMIRQKKEKLAAISPQSSQHGWVEVCDIIWFRVQFHESIFSAFT